MDMDKLPDSMKLYSLKQAAEILGASTRTLLRYFADGRLAGQKVGGRWKVSQAALSDFLEQGKAGTLADCLAIERASKIQENTSQS